MEFLHTIKLVYVASGFGVGFLVGLTGVGGGALMTPLLILLFNIHPVTAVGTDLLYAAITKTGGTLVHGFNKTISWRIVARLAVGSVPASILTVTVLHFLNIDSSQTNAVISKVLSVALLMTALALVFRGALVRFSQTHVNDFDSKLTRNLTIATGVVVGVLVTVSSVGAGALGMTALILLYSKQPLARLVGSDIAHAVPLTLVAGLGHLMLGSIDLVLLGSLLLGSLPGIILASTLAARTPDIVIRYMLAAVLTLVGVKLFGNHSS